MSLACDGIFIPNDIVAFICSFLSVQEFHRLVSVSKTWQQFIRNNQLWNSFFVKDFPTEPTPPDQNYYEAYLNLASRPQWDRSLCSRQIGFEHGNQKATFKTPSSYYVFSEYSPVFSKRVFRKGKHRIRFKLHDGIGILIGVAKENVISLPREVFQANGIYTFGHDGNCFTLSLPMTIRAMFVRKSSR